MAAQTLSAAQISALASGAGWSGSQVAVATAVALAESSGHPDARGDVALAGGQWGPSIGLWQIRSLVAQRGTGAQRDEVANRDPATNAQHAHAIWQGSGWGAWSTHTSGAYLLYMPAAQAASRTSGGAITTGATAAQFASFTTNPQVQAAGLKEAATGAGDLLRKLMGLPGGLVDTVTSVAVAPTLLARTYVWILTPANRGRIAIVAVGALMIGAATVKLVSGSGGGSGSGSGSGSGGGVAKSGQRMAKSYVAGSAGRKVLGKVGTGGGKTAAAGGAGEASAAGSGVVDALELGAVAL